MLKEKAAKRVFVMRPLHCLRSAPFLTAFIFFVFTKRQNFSLKQRTENLSRNASIGVSNASDNLQWAETQRLRVHRVSETCSQRNVTTELDVRLPYNIVVDTHHGVVFCAIPKAACSSWRSVLAHLSNKTSSFPSMLHIPVHDARFMRSIGIVELKEFTAEQQTQIIENYPKFLVVRHPLERLVSAFREKLEAHNRHTRYFHTKYGRRIIRGYRAKGPRSRDVKFEEFVTWLVDGGSTTDEHWASYQRLCLPCHIRYTYIINYDSFNEDTSQVLRLLFNESFDAFPRRNSLQQNSKLVLKNYTSRLTKEQIYGLQTTYADDFEMFEYSKMNELIH